MPCRDDGPITVEDPETKKRLDLATRVACKLLRALEDGGNAARDVARSDPEVYAWWSAHKKADDARARADALKKLTPAERKLLGVE